MREPAQRALQLDRAHLIEPLAELLQDGDDDQPAVPCPEALDLLADDVLRRRDVAAPLDRGLRRHCLEIVDVIEEDVLELGDCGSTSRGKPRSRMHRGRPPRRAIAGATRSR